MKVTIAPPAERNVSVEMPEGVAYALALILKNVYAEEASDIAVALEDLRVSLASSDVMNTGNTGVVNTHRGIRLYNKELEW